MLRSSPQLKQFVVGWPRRVDEQLAAQGEGAECILEAQAFKLENRANRQEDVVALRPQSSRG
jgi:hypothetical protein